MCEERAKLGPEKVAVALLVLAILGAAVYALVKKG
jgi:hypothetical protein